MGHVFNIFVTNAIFDGVKFPVSCSELQSLFDYKTNLKAEMPGSDLFNRYSSKRYCDSLTTEEVVKCSIPTSRKVNVLKPAHNSSNTLNALTVLASLQRSALEELVKNDVIVKHKYIYEFYYLDASDLIRSHGSDEFPSHCIYVLLGDRKLSKAVLKTLKFFIGKTYGGSVNVIRTKYDTYYHKMKG